MKSRKLAASVAALFVGITMSTLSIGVAEAASAAPTKAQSASSRPLPPKCNNPKYVSSTGECIILY